MAQARVDNIEALKAFKLALLKFAETASTALADAEADAAGTLRWLESEQRTAWQNAVRKSQELVARAEEALRHKRIFKDSSGRTPSAVDEEKALAKAKRMLEHAEERLENVRRYTPRLSREILLYKGQAQRLVTFVAGDIPAAAAKLDKMTQALEAYVNLAPAGGEIPAMNLPSDAAPAPPAEAPAESVGTSATDPSPKSE
jgi:hypothetical protein